MTQKHMEKMLTNSVLLLNRANHATTTHNNQCKFRMSQKHTDKTLTDSSFAEWNKSAL
jgi:hypothetical protein